MRLFSYFRSALGLVAYLPLSFVLTSAGLAQSRTSDMPPAVEHGGVSLGLEAPTTPLSATVWLTLHDQPVLDAAVRQMYTKGSPSYHHWMSRSDLARFEPTAAEVAAVKAELAAHHLSVVKVDPANLSVKFTGQTSDFEAAFHTQLSRYQIHGRVLRASSAMPRLTGGATGLVRAVTGFEGSGMHPFHSVPVDFKTGKQIGIRPLANLSPDGAIYSNQCLDLLNTITLKGSGGTTATYTGLGYGASPNNTVDGTIGPCAYSPEDVWRLYSLTNVYAAGYQGAGQTIVLVDAYGSPTLSSDLAAFSSVYGLPSPSITYYASDNLDSTDAGWAAETTLDVEWAHAIAPQASLVAIAMASSADDELQSGVLFAVENQLGNVISNSYGSPETEESYDTLFTWDEINEMAAAQGISVQYATGDNGDYSTQIGYPDVSTPADSSFGTAVGGTAMAFSPLDQSTLQTGWGNNVTELSSGNAADNPPVAYGFQGGAGGGLSSFFSKPSYQAALPGEGRHLPDISALADPYTGVEIVFTDSGTQYVEAIGGTSLATPIFSAMWAMVDEYYGVSQGQAAPFIAYGFPLTVDVTAASTVFNPAGSITDTFGKTNYSTYTLSQPLGGVTTFGAALWNAGGGTYYNLTFGTDSSLTVTPGWDNVTGYGTFDFAAF
jgi:subtilase family serine protease